MNIHNQLKQSASLLRALRASLGEDHEVNVERLGETLTPTLDIWSKPEWAFLRGERLCSGSANATGAVGTRGHIQLKNPTGSDHLVVLEHVIISTDTTGRLFGIFYDTDLTTNTAQVAFRERRWRDRGPLVPVAQVRTQAVAVVSGSSYSETHVLASTAIQLPSPIVLSPGRAFVVVFGADGVVQITASFFWRERPPLPGELVAT